MKHLNDHLRAQAQHARWLRGVRREEFSVYVDEIILAEIEREQRAFEEGRILYETRRRAAGLAYTLAFQQSAMGDHRLRNMPKGRRSTLVRTRLYALVSAGRVEQAQDRHGAYYRLPAAQRKEMP